MKTAVGAKLNLSLAVTGKRGKMHTLDMRVCSCDLCDEIAAVPAHGRTRFVFRSDLPEFRAELLLPLIERSYGILSAKYGESEYAFEIVKRIPPSAGLGGSSAVGAGLARLFACEKGCEIDDDTLLSLGSDVPYMYRGGEARVTGVGECVEQMPFEERYAVIVVPDGRVDTARAYALFDETGKGDGADCGAVAETLRRNDLYFAACKINPEIASAAAKLKSAGADDVVMSGSGSAVCAFFGADDKKKARMVYDAVANSHRVYFVATTRGFRYSD